MIDKLTALLSAALGYLKDERLYESERAPRKRGETIQQHEDRISMVIQRNEDLKLLIAELHEALGPPPPADKEAAHEAVEASKRIVGVLPANGITDEEIARRLASVLR